MRYAICALLLSVACAAPGLCDYDPLAGPKSTPETKDATVHDEKRSREIPIRIYFPTAKTPAPLVLFSHGLGGSRENSAYLGRQWSNRGYLTVCLQHAGSDESVWKNAPLRERMTAMRKAASLQNLKLRLADVPAVLDQLEKWNKTAGDPLSGRIDMTRVGMSGHSFGAVTTQGVSGQMQAFGSSSTDPRIKAAVVMSPSPPRVGDAKKVFGSVKIPWMLMTGTKDVAAVGDISVEQRLSVFPALPEGGKYELVLHDGAHGAFSDRALPGERGNRNPNHHKLILALSTAFWDAHLKNDADAKKWLDGDGAKSLLEKDDRWQKK